MRFDTLLIANRGEIAVRIVRTARRMGLRTVAVHSSADVAAPHVRAADIAVEIGPPDPARSYLVADRIIAAARRTGAQAIHPGYGFLSESAAFAQACIEAGLVFVGPRPAAISAMGDKAEAKQRMRAAGVPVIPGYDGTEQNDERLAAEAGKIGFPIMVKAAAGGGGKGMRLVDDDADLIAALAGARRESQAAFGSSHLLLERALARPRHVEVQVLADTHGHIIHLGERDCSIQRRHQKVLEEAPSPAVDAPLRRHMGEAGVAAARAVDYVGAGTVEFLLDAAGDFFFLEMNTRLQVEHPVTEMVTGLDLVEWQLRIAQGEDLTIAQDEVTITGHAIEARLYAEDPARDHLPSTGVIRRWETPEAEGLRVDAGVDEGTIITPHYDPMIAKVIAHGADREQARVRLLRGLQGATVLGPVTNRTMLAATLQTAAFAAGQVTTAFLDDHALDTASPMSRHVAALAAWRYDLQRQEAASVAGGLAGWSSTGVLGSAQRLRIDDEVHIVHIRETLSGLKVRVGDVTHDVALDSRAPVVDGLPVSVRGVELRRGHVLMAFDDLDLEAHDLTVLPREREAVAGEGALLAPMHGIVCAVLVAPGDTVVAGQRLLVLEAMKMEHEMTAGVDGVVVEIAGMGTQVSADQVLAVVDPANGEADPPA